MKDKTVTPMDMPDLPITDVYMDGATDNAKGGLSNAAIRRGYQVLDASPPDMWGEPAMTEQTGDPWGPRGGFLGRPRGSEY